jgi:WD40 repeat protein
MSRHTANIQSIAFSPNGLYALSGGNDATVHLWELITSKKLFALTGHKGTVWTVCFSPDGNRALSSGDDKIIRLWNLHTGQELLSMEGHTQSVRTVMFSPDGRMALSGSFDKSIRLWDLTTGREIYKIETPVQQDGRQIVSFSIDGSIILSAVSFDKDIYRIALDWDYDFPAPADWDEGARPYLDIFLTLHTPYGPDGLSRVGKPQWTEEDFQKLLQELGYRGYGWLRPEGVRRELEKMAKERS